MEVQKLENTHTFYFVEVSNERLPQNYSSASETSLSYCLADVDLKAPILDELNRVESFSPLNGDTVSCFVTECSLGSDSLLPGGGVIITKDPLRNDSDEQPLEPQEVVCATSEFIEIPRPEEASVQLKLKTKRRMPPHLIDHVYSLACTSVTCFCGNCGSSCLDLKESNTFQSKNLKSSAIGENEEYEESNEKKISYKCGLCNYTASRRQHVKQHLATHLVDKPYKCKMCDYSASQKQSLVAHGLRFHFKRKPFKCGMCDYSAFRKQHVVVHMGKHMKEKPYKCDDCDFQTSWKEYLGVHKKNLHPASKSFKPWCE